MNRSSRQDINWTSLYVCSSGNQEYATSYANSEHTSLSQHQLLDDNMLSCQAFQALATRYMTNTPCNQMPDAPSHQSSDPSPLSSASSSVCTPLSKPTQGGDAFPTPREVYESLLHLWYQTPSPSTLLPHSDLSVSAEIASSLFADCTPSGMIYVLSFLSVDELLNVLPTCRALCLSSLFLFVSSSYRSRHVLDRKARGVFASPQLQIHNENTAVPTPPLVPSISPSSSTSSPALASAIPTEPSQTPPLSDRLDDDISLIPHESLEDDLFILDEQSLSHLTLNQRMAKIKQQQQQHVDSIQSQSHALSPGSLSNCTSPRTLKTTTTTSYDDEGERITTTTTTITTAKVQPSDNSYVYSTYTPTQNTAAANILLSFPHLGYEWGKYTTRRGFLWYFFFVPTTLHRIYRIAAFHELDIYPVPSFLVHQQRFDECFEGLHWNPDHPLDFSSADKRKGVCTGVIEMVSEAIMKDVNRTIINKQCRCHYRTHSGHAWGAGKPLITTTTRSHVSPNPSVDTVSSPVSVIAPNAPSLTRQESSDRGLHVRDHIVRSGDGDIPHHGDQALAGSRPSSQNLPHSSKPISVISIDHCQLATYSDQISSTIHSFPQDGDNDDNDVTGISPSLFPTLSQHPSHQSKQQHMESQDITLPTENGATGSLPTSTMITPAVTITPQFEDYYTCAQTDLHAKQLSTHSPPISDPYGIHHRNTAPTLTYTESFQSVHDSELSIPQHLQGSSLQGIADVKLSYLSDKPLSLHAHPTPSSTPGSLGTTAMHPSSQPATRQAPGQLSLQNSVQPTASSHQSGSTVPLVRTNPTIKEASHHTIKKKPTKSHLGPDAHQGAAAVDDDGQCSHCFRLSNSSLCILLHMIAYTFPDIGYCQGMNFVTAQVLLQCDLPLSYAVLCQLFAKEESSLHCPPISARLSMPNASIFDQLPTSASTIHTNGHVELVDTFTLPIPQPLTLLDVMIAPYIAFDPQYIPSTEDSEASPTRLVHAITPCLPQPLRHRSFFYPNLIGMRIARIQFTQLLRHHLPRIFQHLRSVMFPIDLISDWFLTLFSSPTFPLPAVIELWDALILHGSTMLFQIVLAIFSSHEEDLLQMNFERVHLFFKQSVPTCFNRVDLLIQKAQRFVITDYLFSSMQSFAVEYIQTHKTNLPLFDIHHY